MEERRLSGLAAQRADQQNRASKLRQSWQKQHDQKHSWKKRIKECPLCQDELRNIKADQKRLEEATAADLEDGASLEMECI